MPTLLDLSVAIMPSRNSMQKAQNESSSFGTNSLLTDAIRPPRSSLFNSSFALPCPFAGIWMNSNGISRFLEIFSSGATPLNPVLVGYPHVLSYQDRSTSLPALVPRLATPFRFAVSRGLNCEPSGTR